MLKRLAIEPTNKCNLSCKHCWSKDSKVEKGFMDFNFYERLIKEAKEIGITGISLNFSGEPTLHPRFADMIRLAPCPVAFATNGLIMTDDILDALSKAKVNGINFSIHNRNNVEKIYANILNVKNIVVNIGATIERGEMSDSDIDYIKQTCPIRVVIKPMIKDMTWITEGYKTIPNYSCDKIQRSMYILWNGKVTLCCRDIGCEMAFGDVMKNGILGVWNSKEYIEKRIAIGTKKFNLDLCKKCNLWKIKFV